MTRALVRIRGITETATFSSERKAKEWATETEHALRNRVIDASGMTVGQIMLKYIDHYKSLNDKMANTIECHYKRFGAEFAKTEIETLNTTAWWLATVRGWRKEDGTLLTPGTARRYLSFICAALTVAEAEWEVKVDWEKFKPAFDILKSKANNRIGKDRERTRRLQPGELDAMRANFPTDTHINWPDVIDFAIITGLRLGEICKLKWADLNEVKKMIWVNYRKGSTPDKPINTHMILMKDSCKILLRQPRTNVHIFPYKSTYLSQQFPLICQRAGIEDFHFHDFRHEAISRMVELGMKIHEVQQISGHRNLNQLMRYFNPKPEDLHKVVARLEAENKRHDERMSA
jgi:integrase